MVSAEEFVKIWQGANSVAEVAEATGMKSKAAYQRAYTYRTHGVPLKSMPTIVVDYKALAELAKSLNGEKK